jgi:hypothetical protein
MSKKFSKNLTKNEMFLAVINVMSLYNMFRCGWGLTLDEVHTCTCAKWLTLTNALAYNNALKGFAVETPAACTIKLFTAVIYGFS